MVGLFVSADENKDGLLTHAELVRHLHQVPWASALLRAELNWTKIWDEYDGDGDGSWVLLEHMGGEASASDAV